MPAPSQDVTWDSGAVHTVATAAGHKTSGWGTDEVPGSDEMNYWMMSVALWINYLKQRDSVTIPFAAAGGAVSQSSYGNGWVTDGSGRWQPQAADNVLTRQIPCQPGEHITAVSVDVTDVASLELLDFKVFKSVVTSGGATVTQLGTTQTSTGAGTQTLQVTGLDETVNSTTLYFAQILVHAGASSFGTATVHGFFYTRDVPAI